MLNPLHKKNIWLKLHIDWPLLLGIIALAALSFVVLYSAKEDMALIQRHFIRLGLASVLMLVVAQIPPAILKKLAIALYLLSLIFLFGVMFLGDISKGAKRWLDLGFIRFQPAELMKIALPLILAEYLEANLMPPKLKTLIVPVLLIFVPVYIIAKQPDLGTALLIASTGIWAIYFSGLRFKVIFYLNLLAVTLAPLAWFFLRTYQRQRILTLLQPERDPLGLGYHIIQSKIAIGSGGIYGRGWLQGTQSHLEYLPERSTDFIFAVFGEEFGFVGALLLISVYLFIVIRGLQIGLRAQTTFARLCAGSFAMTFFVYVFVNIAMVTGMLPVVGIPLPLISYGGTSLATLMVSFGILMSIETHRSLLVD